MEGKFLYLYLSKKKKSFNELLQGTVSSHNKDLILFHFLTFGASSLQAMRQW